MSYRNLLKKEYLFVYAIYFFVFFAIGSLDQQIPLFFDTVENGAVIYGVFLSALSFANIVLPTVAVVVAKKIGAKMTGVVCFAFTVLMAGALFLATNAVLIAALFFMINISQIVFNFSLGSAICLAVDSRDKGKFFAVRDVFLYGSISLGLFLSGILVKHVGMKEIIAGYAAVMAIPLVLLLAGGKNRFIREDGGEEAEKFTLKGIRKALRNRTFVLLLVVSALLAVYGCVYSYVPMLATGVGLDYTGILNSFAIVTVINVVLALFLSGVADATGRKLFFVVDIVSDLIPITLFMLSENALVFTAALVLAALKDVFAPITFAYKYGLFDEKDGPLYISLLESVTGIFTFVLPTVIGVLWESCGKWLFALAFVAVLAAGIVAAFLPDVPAEKADEA